MAAGRTRTRGGIKALKDDDDNDEDISLVEQVVEDTRQTDVDYQKQHQHPSTFTPVLSRQTTTTVMSIGGFNQRQGEALPPPQISLTLKFVVGQKENGRNS